MNSGLQRKHIQNFGQSQFYKAYFSTGPSAKYAGLKGNCILSIYYEFWTPAKHERHFGRSQF